MKKEGEVSIKRNKENRKKSGERKPNTKIKSGEVSFQRGPMTLLKMRCRLQIWLRAPWWPGQKKESLHNMSLRFKKKLDPWDKDTFIVSQGLRGRPPLSLLCVNTLSDASPCT